MLLIVASAFLAIAVVVSISNGSDLVDAVFPTVLVFFSGFITAIGLRK